MDSWDSNSINVTNLEKTIVDMLLHKNPMPGIVDEMIDDYVAREDKNIDKLMDYACRFDVLDIIKERILPSN
jgi:predicted transcriptional regulator of viral defense system